jgi:hypothetical protein
MVRTQIQLTKDQVQAIKRIAAAQGISLAAVVRRAIDTMLRAAPAEDREDQRKRALEIVGKFRSGKSDVSTRHDAHLAEVFRK